IVESGRLTRDARASAHQTEAAVVGDIGGELATAAAVRAAAVRSSEARLADGDLDVLRIEACAAAAPQRSKQTVHVAKVIALVAYGLDLDRRAGSAGGVGGWRGNAGPAFVESIERQRAA